MTILYTVLPVRRPLRPRTVVRICIAGVPTQDPTERRQCKFLAQPLRHGSSKSSARTYLCKSIWIHIDHLKPNRRGCWTSSGARRGRLEIEALDGLRLRTLGAAVRLKFFFCCARGVHACKCKCKKKKKKRPVTFNPVFGIVIFFSFFFLFFFNSRSSLTATLDGDGYMCGQGCAIVTYLSSIIPTYICFALDRTGFCQVRRRTQESPPPPPPQWPMRPGRHLRWGERV